MGILNHISREVQEHHGYTKYILWPQMQVWSWSFEDAIIERSLSNYKTVFNG